MMNPRLKNPRVWIPIVIAVSFAAGMWTGSAIFTRTKRWNGQEKLASIMRLIESQYVDDVDIDSLLEASIPDILAHLDPHSVYIPKSELQAVNDELEGSFSGIGVTFSIMNDTVTVLEVISGGPSEKAGLLPGDLIVAVNDSSTIGWNNETVMRNLRGDKDTVVKLGIRRTSAPGKTFDYEVTRGDIPVHSIDAAYMADAVTGYIKVNKFGSTTYSEFLQAILELTSEGARNYIVDLRGNGGGYMQPAILMANEFLPAQRLIVSTKGRNKALDEHAFSDGSGSLQDAGLTVLLDEYSASASEIFAGAIQDNDRGMVIGRRSFGKGLVQNQTVLPDSSAIRLTVQRYYTPSGRCIQKTYKPGDVDGYNNEILERYARGEAYSADSIKLDKTLIFQTISGRTVYGGGGIMPDVFVPNDTSAITSWYLNVANSGLLRRFAFKYADENRAELSRYDNLDDMLDALPADDLLLQEFVNYAADNNVAPRWYYINISRDLLVNQLKAFIVRDLLDMTDFYRIWNIGDPVIERALQELSASENN